MNRISTIWNNTIGADHSPGRMVATLAVGFGIVLVFAVVLWKVPGIQVPEGVPPDRRAELENVSRITIAIIEFGLIVTSVLLVLWARLRDVERSIWATREGRLGDRFDRAIAQLTEENEAVVMGGIYALERVARDSTAEHWKVVEILTAYVRFVAGIEENSASQHAGGQDSDRSSVKSSVQAVLDVLSRRNRHQETPDQRIDLRKTDLQGANLQGAHLERAILFGSRLQWADLRGAHLENSILWGVNLEGANLDGAHLEGANFWEARLEAARISGSHLQGASLLNVNGLTQDQIELAYIDESTVLPEGITPPGATHPPEGDEVEENAKPSSDPPRG